MMTHLKPALISILTVFVALAIVNRVPALASIKAMINP